MEASRGHGGPPPRPQSSTAWWLFFFSSRRRHTRSLRDWSSDVCSSDLMAWRNRSSRRRSRWRSTAEARPRSSARGPSSRARSSRPAIRSEERRVGKECRSRWSPDDSKKKEEGQERAGDAGRWRRRADMAAHRRVLKVAPRGGCFFFQAEDGIRDLYVTGVQTCALPI